MLSASSISMSMIAGLRVAAALFPNDSTSSMYMSIGASSGGSLSRGKGLDRITQRSAYRTHCGPQTEDKRVQDSHSEPYAKRSSIFLRGIDQHRPVACVSA